MKHTARTHAATIWLCATAVAILLSTSFHLDDMRHEMGVSADLQDAIRAEAREQRFAKAAQALCGPNAGYALQDDGSVQCYTHKGRKTIKVAL